jgi:hypothetical protein
VYLWPGLDTALKKEPTEDDKYRWLAAERILSKLVGEAQEMETKVVIVTIPYLAQVYDATWAASFRARPDVYDRSIAGQRLAELCLRIGAWFGEPDGTGNMQIEYRWLQDANLYRKQSVLM